MDHAGPMTKTTRGAFASTIKSFFVRAWNRLRTFAERIARLFRKALTWHQNRMRTDDSYRKRVSELLASAVATLRATVSTSWVGMAAAAAVAIYLLVSQPGAAS